MEIKFLNSILDLLPYSEEGSWSLYHGFQVRNQEFFKAGEFS